MKKYQVVVKSKQAIHLHIAQALHYENVNISYERDIKSAKLYPLHLQRNYLKAQNDETNRTR